MIRTRSLVYTLALLVGIVSVTLASGLGTVASQNSAPSLDGFSHPEWLADATWVSEHLADDSVMVVALTPEESFIEAHIPGAAQVDWPAFEIVETDDASIESWQSEVEELLTSLGVERDKTVIVYDGGTFIAARVWWILHQLGHEDVRVLNGGLEAWEAEGFETAAGESTVGTASERYEGEARAEALVTIDEAVTALDQGEATFIDARRYDDEFAVGHIPGAVNVPFMANAAAEGPKFWRSAEELSQLYMDAGITLESDVIVYCATGVRSSVTYFTLKQLGFENVSLFTGSFIEWSADSDRPVDTVE